MAQGIEMAIGLWPTAFIGLWAYPFIAIPYMRHRRLVMDLAAIVSDGKPRTYFEACRILKDFQIKIRRNYEE